MKTMHAERAAGTGVPAIPDGIRERLIDYLHRLGVQDPELSQSLAAHCLSHAKRRVGAGMNDELLRRAIEEAQHCMDAGLARLLGLSVTRDAHTIAGARTALLMCMQDGSTDFVFSHTEPEHHRLSRLKAALPRPVPPESPRAMLPQKLDFFFFKSS